MNCPSHEYLVNSLQEPWVTRKCTEGYTQNLLTCFYSLTILKDNEVGQGTGISFSKGLKLISHHAPALICPQDFVLSSSSLHRCPVERDLLAQHRGDMNACGSCMLCTEFRDSFRQKTPHHFNGPWAWEKDRAKIKPTLYFKQIQQFQTFVEEISPVAPLPEISYKYVQFSYCIWFITWQHFFSDCKSK